MSTLQSIQAVETVSIVEMSYSEMRANWECAATLARKEGMYGVSERLHADIETMDKLFNRGDVLSIQVKR